jgi:hypothetical protein
MSTGAAGLTTLERRLWAPMAFLVGALVVVVVDLVVFLVVGVR